MIGALETILNHKLLMKKKDKKEKKEKKNQRNQRYFQLSNQ